MYLRDGNLIWVGTGKDKVLMVPKMANRHGLIAGATGTGKTVTLKVLSEAFSDMGVPVFLADVKGDLTGMAVAGEPNKHVQERVDSMHIENFGYQAYPTRFFDVFGKKGHPVRARVSDLGPDLLARLMALSDTQTGVLNLIFKIADDKHLLLIDMKDLKAMVRYVGDHAADFRTEYGNITPQSVGAIQRALIQLESQGAETFFGEPSLEIEDWMACDPNGRGFLNVLECEELFLNPLLYSTFLLWMLSELYESLPEAGDLDKPKMIFFFDEAHLLFSDAPKALLQKVEQVVRLIRSKGVGIYFITQTPSDVPDSILSQLGNKIQHALHAYTPSDQKALRATAQSFRANPEFDSEKTLAELGTGEALVSMLDEKGVPGIVQRVYILPPQSSMSPCTPDAFDAAVKGSPLYSKYQQTVDRESAYEDLAEEADAAQAEVSAIQQEQADQKARIEELKLQEREAKLREREARAAAPRKSTSSRSRKSPIEKSIDATMASMGREVGRDLVRGILGSFLKF